MQTQGHDKGIRIQSPGVSHQNFLVHGHISKNVGECDLVFDDHLRHAVNPEVVSCLSQSCCEARCCLFLRNHEAEWVRRKSSWSVLRWLLAFADDMRPSGR